MRIRGTIYSSKTIHGKLGILYHDNFLNKYWVGGGGGAFALTNLSMARSRLVWDFTFTRSCPGMDILDAGHTLLCSRVRLSIAHIPEHMRHLEVWLADGIF